MQTWAASEIAHLNTTEVSIIIIIIRSLKDTIKLHTKNTQRAIKSTKH